MMSKIHMVLILICLNMTGLRNSGSQMSASFTSTGKHIISVGEDSRVYIWNYDSHPPAPSHSKHIKSIHSCEHFFSEGVSVALPWLGSTHDAHHNESLPSHRQQQIRGADGFSLGNWFSIDNQCCSGRAATWPEEQLPLYAAAANNDNLRVEIEKCKQVSEAWNAVIVTGSLDGRIRTFHNFGVSSS